MHHGIQVELQPSSVVVGKGCAQKLTVVAWIGAEPLHGTLRVVVEVEARISKRGANGLAARWFLLAAIKIERITERSRLHLEAEISSRLKTIQQMKT